MSEKQNSSTCPIKRSALLSCLPIKLSTTDTAECTPTACLRSTPHRSPSTTWMVSATSKTCSAPSSSLPSVIRNQNGLLGSTLFSTLKIIVLPRQARDSIQTTHKGTLPFSCRQGAAAQGLCGICTLSRAQALPAGVRTAGK